MIGYVTLGTNDRARSAAFYDAVCGELGVGRMMETEEYIGWGVPGGGAGIGLTRPFDGNPASVGTCEGPPGERFPGFYAAYFRDPDGNKLNVHFMTMGE